MKNKFYIVLFAILSVVLFYTIKSDNEVVVKKTEASVISLDYSKMTSDLRESGRVPCEQIWSLVKKNPQVITNSLKIDTNGMGGYTSEDILSTVYDSLNIECKINLTYGKVIKLRSSLSEIYNYRNLLSTYNSAIDMIHNQSVDIYQKRDPMQNFLISTKNNAVDLCESVYKKALSRDVDFLSGKFAKIVRPIVVEKSFNVKNAKIDSFAYTTDWVCKIKVVSNNSNAIYWIFWTMDMMTYYSSK